MTNCNLCGRTADFAVHSLVSTKGVSPRTQKCSFAVPFCKSCLQAICNSNHTQVPLGLMQALRQAYAALADVFSSESEGAKQ